ncbi:hypothetical protein G6F59_018199 [Rhizopus arrhizus]|nr:hypothetical protein G6F59_018199 [Rhizopus arrhizus]
MRWFHRRCRSTWAPAPATTPSSGRWVARTSITPTCTCWTSASSSKPCPAATHRVPAAVGGCWPRFSPTLTCRRSTTTTSRSTSTSSTCTPPRPASPSPPRGHAR